MTQTSQARCDDLRKFIALFISNEKVINSQVVKRAGYTKDKLANVCQKSAEIPFCEPGAADKIDYNTLRVAFYKLVRASNFKLRDVCAVVMAPEAEVQMYLNSVRDQVEE